MVSLKSIHSLFETNKINPTILNKENLIEISYILKSPKIKTFKIVYVRDSVIIDYESILFNYSKDQYLNVINKIANRLYNLNADSYYVLCNYNFKCLSLSVQDIRFIKSLIKDVQGFLGYLILGKTHYRFIAKNGNRLLIERKKAINPSLGLNMQKVLVKNPFLILKINSKNDLINILYEMNNSKNFSTLVITNSDNRVVLVKDISNYFIVISYKKIGNYIRHLLNQVGGQNAFLVTQNKFFFVRALDLKSEKYITSCVAYNRVGKSLKIIGY